MAMAYRETALAVLVSIGLLRLDLKSAADPSEAKAKSISRRDWGDPQTHHEQRVLDGLITPVGLENPRKA
jgi:hypothetical protein